MPLFTFPIINSIIQLSNTNLIFVYADTSEVSGQKTK